MPGRTWTGRPAPPRATAGTAGTGPGNRPPARFAAVLALQRAAGNAAVTGLVAPVTPVQRAHSAELGEHGLSEQQQKDLPDPATAKTLATEFTQLRAKWSAADRAVKAAKKAGQPVTMADSGFSAEDDARLTEVMRLLNIRRRGDEADTLADNKIKGGLAAWFAQVGDVPFLGRTARVHKLLAERLAKAEDALKTETPPAGGWLAESPSGLREPGQGLHSFGLAIDLNGSTNPWLVSPDDSHASLYEDAAQSRGVRDIIDRAVLLVLGRAAKDEDLSSRPAETDRDTRVDKSYDKLQEASGALERYLTLDAGDKSEELAGLAGALSAKDPKARTAADWVKTIQADRKKLASLGSAKSWTKPQTGFLHLDKRLVKAMTDSTGAALTWLGDDTVAAGRDIMHFDMRGIGTINHVIDSQTGTTYLGNG
jgi:hypothetical protein